MVLMYVACMKFCIVVESGNVKVGVVCRVRKMLLELRLMFPLRLRLLVEGIVVFGVGVGVGVGLT
jgi:hypothetical protein